MRPPKPKPKSVLKKNDKTPAARASDKEAWFGRKILLYYRLRGYKRLKSYRLMIVAELNNKGFKDKVKSQIDEVVLSYHRIFELTTIAIDADDLPMRRSLLTFGKSSNWLTISVYKQFVDNQEKDRKNMRYDLMQWEKKWRLWSQTKTNKDKELEMPLLVIKRRQWCRLCGMLASKTMQCCGRGEYCSYLHLKADKSHFIWCKRH